MNACAEPPFTADAASCAAVAGRIRESANRLRATAANDAITLRLADDAETLGTTLAEFAAAVRHAQTDLDEAERAGLPGLGLAQLRHWHATEIGKARHRLLRHCARLG